MTWIGVRPVNQWSEFLKTRFTATCSQHSQPPDHGYAGIGASVLSIGIVDMAVYDGRMDRYWEFVNRFYTGAGVLRVPSHNDEPLLVELFDRRVLVAAFNSCSSNDCFRRRAEINPEALARMHLDLRHGWAYDLRVAVWHHNIAGPPSGR